MIDFGKKIFEEEEITVNITSMIDVIFILLIFFMVSTQFKKNSLPLNLPRSSDTTQEKSDSEINVLSVTDDELFLNGNLVDFENLYQSLLLEKEKNPQASLSFECENTVEFQRVVNILTEIQKAGITRIGITHEFAE
ncbi:MAG: biopolymer transporter ExbD [Treponema sp.]|nr:biopolymer transporter ExbD [Treponema sp.]